MTYDHVMHIHRVPVGPNGPKGLLRMHHSERTKYNRLWKLEIRSHIQSPSYPDAISKKHVSIHQVRTRLMDDDNLVASCKPIFDAIVTWGLLFDDDPEHLIPHVTQERGKPQTTTIRIWTEETIVSGRERSGERSAVGFCEDCGTNIYTTFSEHQKLKHMRQLTPRIGQQS